MNIPSLSGRLHQYIIFSMYMNEAVILKHCSVNVYIKHCLLRKSRVLRSGSVAHNALRKVALQETLLQDVKKLTGFHMNYVVVNIDKIVITRIYFTRY